MENVYERLQQLARFIMGSYTPIVPDIPSLVSKLTFEEKVTLLAGKDFWQIDSIDRLEIPVLKTSDGPNGARGAQFKGGVPSACFPACVSLASTFDKSLARRIGKALAQETRTKGASVLLGPTVCLHRDPRGGRNFESFSEDPVLAGELASEYIKGLQDEGIAATPKHYAVNESETKRFTIDCRVSQRALRELYLKPFEILVKNSDPWALMTSYNLVNGTHADMSKFLITDVLREQWGFKGLVMSDWGGTNSTAPSLNAGHDLEMPGPRRWRTVEKISEAIKKGELTEDTLDKAVHRYLELLVKVDKFNNPTVPPEQAIDLPEHRQLIRQAGAEGMVLLKNANGILPLRPNKLKSVALIGLAKEFLGHGGGSAAVNAHHKITAFDALTEAIGDQVELKYAEGTRILRNLNALQQDIYDDDGKPGITARVYSTTSEQPQVKNMPNASFQSLENPTISKVVLTCSFKPTTSGSHYLSFATIGHTLVTINGQETFRVDGAGVDPMAFLLGTASEERKQYKFNAGQIYSIKIEAQATSGASSDLSLLSLPIVGLNLGFATEQEFEADLYTPAIDLAKQCDVTIVFTGHTPTWETEGCDRDMMDLPMNGSLDRLVAGAASVNSNTIVVNSTGSPVTMPWIQDVAAVLQAWFPGQEAGYAIADVLLGKVNPSGKLPVTFPRTIEDAPSFGNFPFTGKLEDLHVDYAEDIFMGYRHYDRKPERVLFPFGFGLSYTTFQVTDIEVSSRSVVAGQTIDVSAIVKNNGEVTGSEVVQVYVGPTGEHTERPKKELAGWTKAQDVAAGQSSAVNTTINIRDAIQYWDESKSIWVVEKGKYVVYVGTSSDDKNAAGKIEIEVIEDATFAP